MLGTSLSELHSRYRAYSVAALDKIPFALDTNDFHFDTEIIIQLVLARMRITQLPTGIVVTSQNERSQMKNRDSAMKVLKSRLFQRQQEESARKREELRGSVMPAEFGSQIRNYVLQPYTLVKDVRTGVEVGNVQSVLEDGDMEPFTEGWLRWRLGQ